MLQFRRALAGDSSQVVTPFVQVGTYPTRNFARVLRMSPCGSDHIFASIARGGWRLASEDSRSRKRSWPFLLIARTARVVTATPTAGRGSDGFTGFPAYGQLQSAGSLLRGADPGHVPGVYLRTVRGLLLPTWPS